MWALGYNFEPKNYPLLEINGHQIRPKSGNIGGACFLVPRRTHEKLGFWCEDYGLYGEEDFDYGIRIRLSGMYNAYMADENIGIHLPAGRAALIDEDTFSAKDGVEESSHTGYRLFKDEQRRINMRGGRVQHNFLRYQDYPDSMYQPSRFAEQWHAHHANLGSEAAAPFHPGTTEKTRINVAILSLEGPGDACAQIRLCAPLNELGDDISLFWAVTVQGDQCTTNLDSIDRADLVVIQRFYPRKGTVPFIERVLGSGKPVIYEVDDLLFDLPDSNHLKPWAAETAELLGRYLPRFTAITLSTPLLKEAFSRFNPNVYVLPNVVDTSLFHPSSAYPAKKITIGFCGTMTHSHDLSLIEDALFRIADTYGDRVEFLFMGYAGHQHSKLPGFRYIDFELGYQSYARKMAGLNIDIALVPLEDIPFNRCKSNIKWLEYSACGVAGVYSDLAPYNSTISQGTTGLLVGNNLKQWYDAIALLIENPDLRRTIAANARTEVLTHHSLAANAHLWSDAYRSIIEIHTASITPEKAPRVAVHTDKPVSIIIPLFNKADYTQRCLEALTANTPRDLYELILVDNGSSDGTHALIGKLPADVTVIRNQVNQGFAKACNQGAQVARGKYLLFLNNDTETRHGWLEPLLNCAEQDSGIAAVGSKLLFPDGTIQHAGVVIADDRVTPDPLVGKHIYYGFPADDPSANVTRRYQVLTAACLLVKRECFREVQGFDEEYWNGYEDVDLCFKLGQKGWKLIYQPDSVVIHYESKSGGERFVKAAQNIRRLHEKWLGKIRADVIIHSDERVEWLENEASATIPSPPLVSIIIPLYNQAHLTKACVEAIRTTSGDPARHELILVNNGSRDWTGEYLKSIGPNVVIITNRENLGFAKACNQGAQAARGEYLLFLNNDTEPQPGWMDALLSGAREDGADIVGAKLLYPNGRVQHAGVAFNKNDIGYHIFKNFAAETPAVNKKRFMQCVTAACMLVSRQLFSELGGFGEQFRNGFEDVDFCLRAGQAGKRVLYTPDAVVIHREEQSEGRKHHDQENMRRYRALWRGKVRCDDEEIYAAEGFSVEWRVDGSCSVHQQRIQHAGGSSSYPLVPLVGSYAETPMARISASARMKAVLKKYSGSSDAAPVTIDP